MSPGKVPTPRLRTTDLAQPRSEFVLHHCQSDTTRKLEGHHLLGFAQLLNHFSSFPVLCQTPQMLSCPLSSSSTFLLKILISAVAGSASQVVYLNANIPFNVILQMTMWWTTSKSLTCDIQYIILWSCNSILFSFHVWKASQAQCQNLPQRYQRVCYPNINLKGMAKRSMQRLGK